MNNSINAIGITRSSETNGNIMNNFHLDRNAVYFDRSDVHVTRPYYDSADYATAALKRSVSSDYELLDISSPTPAKLVRQASTASTSSYDSYATSSTRKLYFNPNVCCSDSHPRLSYNHLAASNEKLEFVVQGEEYPDKNHAHPFLLYNDDLFLDEISVDSLHSSPVLQPLQSRSVDHNVDSKHGKGSTGPGAIIQGAKNPADVVRVKHIQGIPLTDNDIQVLLKDRQKKDNHNLIERRRRFNINDKIRELSHLLPLSSSSNPPTDSKKLNKGVILKESVDYIKLMIRELNELRVLRNRYSTLNELNKELLKRVEHMEKNYATSEPSAPAKTCTLPTMFQNDERKYNDLLNDISYPLATNCATHSDEQLPSALSSRNKAPDQRSRKRSMNANLMASPCASVLSGSRCRDETIVAFAEQSSDLNVFTANKRSQIVYSPLDLVGQLKNDPEQYSIYNEHSDLHTNASSPFEMFESQLCASNGFRDVDIPIISEPESSAYSSSYFKDTSGGFEMCDNTYLPDSVVTVESNPRNVVQCLSKEIRPYHMNTRFREAAAHNRNPVKAVTRHCDDHLHQPANKRRRMAPRA